MIEELSVQDLIVSKLMVRPVKSQELEKILKEYIDSSYNHNKVRAYMRALEEKLAEEGILIESSVKGYFIPTTPEQAAEGLEFIRRKAVSLMKRYNQRLILYRKKFILPNQLRLFEDK